MVMVMEMCILNKGTKHIKTDKGFDNILAFIDIQIKHVRLKHQYSVVGLFE